MKKIFLLSFILFTGPAFSIGLDTSYNYRFEKEVVLTCSEDEYFCEDLCEVKEKCVVKENVCRDCIGSTPYLTHIFNQLGRSIVKSDAAQVEDLIELLKSEQFVTITYKSIYNHVDPIRKEKQIEQLKEKFKSLCDFKVEKPVVIFELKEVSKLLGRPKLLVCDGEIYHVDANGGVVLLEE